MAAPGRTPSRRLILLFAVAILVPGSVLTALVVRAMVEEQAAAESDLAERRRSAADQAAADVTAELAAWAHALDGIVPGAVAARALPERLGGALADQTGGLLLWRRDGIVTSEPPAGLLYELEDGGLLLGRAEPRPTPTDLRLADLRRAGLALAGRGRLDEALATFARVAASNGHIGRLPAALVGQYESCALLDPARLPERLGACAARFYHSLLAGHWRLSKYLAIYYLDQARAWWEQAEPNSPDLQQARREDEARRRLTEAAGALAAAWPPPGNAREPRCLALGRPDGVYLGCWQAAAGEPRAALLVTPAHFRTVVLPRALERVRRERFHAAVTAADGRTVYESGPPPGDATRAVPRVVDAAGVGWRVAVWLEDPSSVYTALRTRRRLQVGVLLLMLASMILASAFGIRAVRKDLELARLKSDFVSTVTHEFRSPIAGIRQLVDLLEEGSVPSAQRRREYYRMIGRENDRLGRLVENVLDLARVEEGRRVFRFQPLDPGPWLRQIAGDFCETLRAGDRPIDVAVDEDLPAISADPDALALAVVNLLDNAVKHSPQCVAVSLSARRENGTMVIRVRDRGPGIPREEQPHIFDRFYRGKASVKGRVGGSGLGLSLVQQIVRAHGGQVSVNSQVGEGTEFVVLLPVASGGQEPATREHGWGRES